MDDTTPVNDTPLHEFEKLVVSQIVRTQKSGVKLYFSNAALLDAKFKATIRDNNLVVEQVTPGEAGVIVRLDSHKQNAMVVFQTMCGPRYVKDVCIPPTVADGRFSWVVPDIPDLRDNRQRRMSHRMLRPLRFVPPASFTRTAEPPPQPEPEPPVQGEDDAPVPPWGPARIWGEWTLDRVKAVLSEVRTVERCTPFRLTRDEQGLAVFSMPPIDV